MYCNPISFEWDATPQEAPDQSTTRHYSQDMVFNLRRYWTAWCIRKAITDKGRTNGVVWASERRYQLR